MNAKPDTVREWIATIQREVRDTDLQPDRAAALLMQATSLIGNCNDEIREADVAYAQRLLVELRYSEKANRAKIQAEVSPEYQRKREARDTKELAIELIRALKYFLRGKAEERQYAGHQP